MYSISRYTTPDLILSPEKLAGWLETWFRTCTVYRPFGSKTTYRILLRITALSFEEIEFHIAALGKAAHPTIESVQRIDDGSIEIRSHHSNQFARQTFLDWAKLAVSGGEGKAVQVQFLSTSKPAEWWRDHEALVVFGLINAMRLELKAVWLKCLPQELPGLTVAAKWPEEETFIQIMERIDGLERSLTFGTSGIHTYQAINPQNAESIRNRLHHFDKSAEIWVEGLRVSARTHTGDFARAVGVEWLQAEAESYFNRGVQGFGSFLVKAIMGVNENLGKFIGITLLQVGLASGCWLALGALRPSRFEIVFKTVLVLTLLSLLSRTISKGKMIAATLKAMRNTMEQLYSRPLEMEEITVETPAASKPNPILDKFAADALAIGGKPFVQSISKLPGGPALARVFFFEKANAYLQIAALTQHDKLSFIPAKPVLVMSTYYPQGHIATIQAKAGYKPKLRREVEGQYLPDVEDVGELLKHHAELVAQYKNTKGQPIYLNKEAFLNRLRADHQIEADLQRGYGYFKLQDAVRQYFEVARKDLKVVRIPRLKEDPWF